MTPPYFRRITLLISFFLTFLYIYISPAHSDDASATPGARVEWKFDDNYQGSHRSDFDQLRWKIPNLMRQTEVNLAVRTGLNFQDGWQYPITIHVVDGAPPGIESALAWVSISSNGDGFAQSFNVNLEAYVQTQFDFEKVFAHELTHAMVNDEIGGEAAVALPTWFQEGLAVFGADQGDQMVKVYANHYFPSAASVLLNGLDGPHTALDYAEDYLAFKYLWDKKGMTAFHNFIQEVMKRKGDIPGALQYTCNVSWDDFQKEFHDYGVEVIKDLGVPHRGEPGQPY